MVNPIHGVRGSSEAKPTGRKKSAPKQSSPPEGDRVEVSEGARLAKSMTRFVHFAKSAPNVRAEAVRAARADLEKGVLFSDEVTRLAAEKFVHEQKPTKK